MRYVRTDNRSTRAVDLLAQRLAALIIKMSRRITAPMNARYNRLNRKQQRYRLVLFIMSTSQLIVVTSWKFTGLLSPRHSGNYAPAFIGKPSSTLPDLIQQNRTNPLIKPKKK